MKKNIKILFVGETNTVNRVSNLIKYLMEVSFQNKYSIAWYRPKFFETSSRNSFFKFCNYFSIIISLFSDFIIKYFYADVIYINPSNHKVFELVTLINRILFKKKIVTELYISYYSTALDRNWITEQTSRSKIDRIKQLDINYFKKSTVLIHPTLTELKSIAKKINIELDLNQIKIIPLCTTQKKISIFRESPDLFIINWWLSWIPLHGIDVVLEAIQILVYDLGEKNIRLNIWGTRDDASIRKYNSIIHSLGISVQVKISCEKSFFDNTLQDFLIENCDLSLGNFGNSQKAKEVLVNKIIEGLALGVAVLSTSNEALKEFIDVDNEIFTVSHPSPKNIAHQIWNIKNNDKERYRRARLGHEKYLSTFTIDNYIKRNLEIIDNLFFS